MDYVLLVFVIVLIIILLHHPKKRNPKIKKNEGKTESRAKVKQTIKKDKSIIKINGLKFKLSIPTINEEENISVVKFTKRDIERSPVVAEILDTYGEF